MEGFWPYRMLRGKRYLESSHFVINLLSEIVRKCIIYPLSIHWTKLKYTPFLTQKGGVFQLGDLQNVTLPMQLEKFYYAKQGVTRGRWVVKLSEKPRYVICEWPLTMVENIKKHIKTPVGDLRHLYDFFLYLTVPLMDDFWSSRKKLAGEVLKQFIGDWMLILE